MTDWIDYGSWLAEDLESLIVDKSIKVDDLLIGDKNAVLIAARILAYGKEYEVEVEGQKVVVDLTKLN